MIRRAPPASPSLFASRPPRRRAAPSLLVACVLLLPPFLVSRPTVAAADNGSRRLEDVPRAQPRKPGELRREPGRLEDVEKAQPRDPNNEGLIWSPRPCPAPGRNAELPMPEVGQTWGEALIDARERVQSAEQAVQETTRAYAVILSRASSRPTRRMELGQKRDAARTEYEDARCALEALEESARREGFDPQTGTRSGQAR